MSPGNGQPAATRFILITILLDAMGMGLLVPVIPELIRELANVNVSDAAVYGGAITALFAVVQFFASPVLGGLSDSFGRRPVILLSLLAFGINYVLMGLAPSILWLFVAQALAGLFGATPSAAAAYIADVTPPEDRARKFGSIGAAFGVGFMVGPALSGIIAEWGLRLPFFVAAGLALANVVYGLLVMPESLAVENRRPFTIRSVNPFGVMSSIKGKPQIIRMLIVILLAQIALQTVPATWPYFTIFQFDWSPRDIGLSIGFYGLMAIIAQGFLLGRFASLVGDMKTTRLSIAALAISSVGFAFSANVWFLVLCIVPNAMGYMVNGSTASIISRHYPANEQGVVQGAIAGTRSLASVITPLMMTWLFQHFTQPGATVVFPGIQFLVAGILAGIALLMLRRTGSDET